MHKPPTDQTTDCEAKSPARIVSSIVLLLGGTALLYGLGIGETDLWAPDEPRYAAIAEELRSFRHGLPGLALLHLNDAPYTQKPPLYFWIAASFGLPFDRVTEFAARAPSAIAGLASVGMTAWIGRTLLGRWPLALLGAGMLATSFRFAFTARRAQLDVLLCGFELLAIALFLVLEIKRGGVEKARQSPGIIAALHAALGAAALVKGPVGWLPLAIFTAYLAWQGRAGAVRGIFPIWSWAISIGPLAAWAVTAVTFAPTGFAEVAIGENLFGRFFAGTSHARPFYYFLYQLPLDFLPWSALLPFGIAVAWRAARGRDPQPRERPPSQFAARFLICWAAIPFLFFSLSAGKRGVYLLPIFPALSLLAGLAATRWRELGLLLTHRTLSKAVALVALVELLLFSVALPLLDAQKSPRPVAQAAAANASPGDVLGVYGMTPIEGGLGYYGAPPIVSLRDFEELVAFSETRNAMMLMRSRHFSEFGPSLHLIEIQSFRSGYRALSLVRAAPR